MTQPDPNKLYHVYVVQTDDAATRAVVVAEAIKPIFRRPGHYRRVTEHPVLRDEATPIMKRLRHTYGLGRVEPVNYFVTAAGLDYAVRQATVPT